MEGIAFLKRRPVWGKMDSFFGVIWSGEFEVNSFVGLMPRAYKNERIDGGVQTMNCKKRCRQSGMIYLYKKCFQCPAEWRVSEQK